MNLSSLMFPLLLVLLAVPLFLSARKQKRAAAEQQQLLSSLEPGDRVMTTSGLYATVADATDDATIDLEIADGVVTTWLRQAVREKIVPADDLDEVEDDEQDAVVDEVAPATAAEIAPPLEHNTKK
ncbi:preprotein translocase subunit YajC [Umezawaea endophytica]|uniref:Preprotein translocase subunit YajC n=1 Tax=Umezawaea endophytica TaxID=1654476 RepID=A0A9X3A3I5_9PSEU|nr:preprotein translocase subunit YajC [Umezawaea endophytica]MCS7481784.1 preprotein translocase subunit YajC [Umezawaea endophytica]